MTQLFVVGTKILPYAIAIMGFGLPFSLPKWRAASVRYEIDKLAIRAFNDYSATRDGVDRNGSPLPRGEDFFADPEKVKEADAWRAAIRVLIYKHPYNGLCWRVMKKDYNGDYVVDRKWFRAIALGWPLFIAALVGIGIFLLTR